MRKPWPQTASQRFEDWRDEFERHRSDHAPTGRHFRVTSTYCQQLYGAHGGRTEATTLGDLGDLTALEKRIVQSQQVVWDAHAAEVMAAVREGGLEATAEALREDEQWIRRLHRDGQPVDVSTDAARWVSGVLGTCPANPLIRSEEIWGLWLSVAGARQICVQVRDDLILELVDAGRPRTHLARALGWSYSRFQRHLTRLEEDRTDLDLRAAAGQVPGVIGLESRRSARSERA